MSPSNPLVTVRMSELREVINTFSRFNTQEVGSQSVLYCTSVSIVLLVGKRTHSHSVRIIVVVLALIHASSVAKALSRKLYFSKVIL